MRLVFCGTPQFAVPTLNALVEAGHDVSTVVTQPDRASGRGLAIQAPPVKLAALEAGLEVLQPEKIKNNEEFRSFLEELKPDAIVVVAYGRIIPGWMLTLPPLGNINLHGSLLPKYRGAAPIQWAIANGEKVTGVTSMRIDAGLDTGDTLLARSLPIGPDETAVELYEALSELGAAVMVETLRGLAENTLVAQKQDDSLATLAPLLKKEDGLMDFNLPARANYDRWRAFQPWPGVHTIWRGKKLLISKMSLAREENQFPVEPGGLVVRATSIFVGCGDRRKLVLDELQVEGKRRMAGGEFLRGYQIKPGERLGV